MAACTARILKSSEYYVSHAVHRADSSIWSRRIVDGWFEVVDGRVDSVFVLLSVVHLGGETVVLEFDGYGVR